MWRRYPTGVVETRSFDPMGRLLAMATTNLASEAWFKMEYEYDAVGSAREMVQSSWNLDNKAEDAVTAWEYDDRYRLTAETVSADGNPKSIRTEYAWDHADNRAFKRVYEVDGSSTSLVSTATYAHNALNQMTGWDDGATRVAYQYDANGNRTNKTVSGGTSSATSYIYDEDNRLVAVALNSPINTHRFAYDYRSRRYYRSTPDTPHMYCVFDGGLSIQEYTGVSQASSLPSESHVPDTEFIRGEGMGGGVGGMVYSIRNGQRTYYLVTIIISDRGVSV